MAVCVLMTTAVQGGRTRNNGFVAPPVETMKCIGLYSIADLQIHHF